jgi:PAS domain S-box-containing protein
MTIYPAGTEVRLPLRKARGRSALAAVCVGVTLALLAGGASPAARQSPVPSQAALEFTAEEREWLKAHPVLHGAILYDMPPYVSVGENGQFTGISADILDRVGRILGVRFEVSRFATMAEVLRLVQAGAIDFAPAAVVTPERLRYGIFTSPFARVPVVIIGNTSTGWLTGVGQAAGKSVCVVRGNFLEELLRRDYPKLQLTLAADFREGLAWVASGKVNVFVGDAAVADYEIQQGGFVGVRVVGDTTYTSEMRVAVTAGPVAARLIEKALTSIPRQERDAIVARWFALRVSPGLTWREVLPVATMLAMMALAAILYWNWRLRTEIALRRASERALAESEEKFRIVFEHSPYAILIIRMSDGHCLDANAVLLGSGGFKDRRELVGRPAEDLNARFVSEADAASIWATLRADGRLNQYQIRVRTGEGEGRHHIVSAFPVTLGGEACLVAASLDIHERVEAENALAHHREHLEELVAARTAELEASNRELESFNYSVSHDLRSPLRHLSGYSNLLAAKTEGLLDAEGQEFLRQIEAAARLMGQLVDDLLAFSRMGRQEMLTAAIDADAMVRDVVASVDPQARGRISWDIGALPPIQGDPAMMRIVFANLIDNAVKYSRDAPAPRVRISATDEPGRVRFAVEDNGVGFDPQYADKLFGVFERLHPSDQFEGTGIGLATVRRIVVRHGGHVVADGRPGGGATFAFSIPRARGQSSGG